jgi:hypothetical protein
LFSSLFFPSSLFCFPFPFFHNNERMKEKKIFVLPCLFFSSPFFFSLSNGGLCSH